MTEMLFDVGIIGDGQLGRMEVQAANKLDLSTIVVGNDLISPASLAGAEVILGGIKSEEAIRELAKRARVLTIEVEHINVDAYQMVQDEGANTQPGAETLVLIGDKLRQKEFLDGLGIPVAPFSEELDERLFTDNGFALADGSRYIVKSRKGGFDGRGNLSVPRLDDPRINRTFGETPVYAEQVMPFDMELSVIVARDINGNLATYPVVETIHKDHICHTVISPAAIDKSVADRATEIAVEAVKNLSGAGIFAVELFKVGNDISINEIAPRVHNSGHHTIESNETSQFTQHLLAVTGQPLGSTEQTVPAAVMVNILGREAAELDWDRLARTVEFPEGINDTYAHFYRKHERMQRKIGHVTALADNRETALAKAMVAKDRFYNMIELNKISAS
ncbi:MAG: phosphoribosylaminoimidazole carboxylase, chloroplastic [Candidatus Saccharibacteria bacterium]|nr:phosphoribosylaminoimidazole carboxylase, chloroplastic [Candidatus Saccharibacteria bacterium]